MWKNMLLLVVFCCFFKLFDILEDLKKCSWKFIALEMALEKQDSRKGGLKPLLSRHSKTRSNSVWTSNSVEHNMKVLCM